MSSPFQAIVWGRVLLLDAFDQAQILAFYEQWGERTNPEKQCAAPSASPAGSGEPGASASARASDTRAPCLTAVPSASAAPTAAASSSSRASAAPSSN